MGAVFFMPGEFLPHLLSFSCFLKFHVSLSAGLLCAHTISPSHCQRTGISFALDGWSSEAYFLHHNCRNVVKQLSGQKLSNFTNYL